MATAKINQEWHIVCAGGAESMSFIPMGGYKPTPDYAVAKAGNEDYYWGMGLTAEAVHNSLKFLEKIKMNLLITLI
jgi:acetyl-CoA acyltransferase